MGKTGFRTFATFTVLLLVLATAFTLIFGLCDTHIFAPLDIASATSAEATTSADYYASVDSLSTNGASFRSSLASLITSTHTKYTSYDGLASVFPKSDEDPNKSGHILWFYTGTSVAYTGGGFGGRTNREHVWPKDGSTAFPERSGPGSDSHHLRPTDSTLNSTRGNKSFNEVAESTGNIVEQNGSISYENLCYTDKTYFYPGVGYRGATARILMYMETRWGDQYNLQFVLGAGHCKTIGDIETLMKWHLEEPVTAAERLRNDEVQKIQGNRNPFIDHPEYAERIYCHDNRSYNKALQAVVAGTNNEPISGLDFKEKSISIPVGETKTLSPIYTPSNAKRDVNWESSDTSVATVDSYGKVTAKANGTTTITVSSKENPSIKASIKVNVKSVSSIALSGNPAKTEYNEGETFAPSGLTVKAIFSDNTSAEINNDDCQWLDAVTGQKSLSKGTTAVTCKYVANGKTFTATYSGITVTKIEGAGKTTIDLAATSASGSSYSWCNWSADSVSGKVFMCKGTNSTIQMNTNKSRKCYLYNSTALPGDIVSITITLDQDGNGKNFEVRTSSTPFSEGTSYPSTGNVAGTVTANTNGVTLKVNSSDRYFAISYKGTGVVYVKSIDILYGQAATECEHSYSAWTTTKEATATENGEKTRTCTKCGHVETQVIPATGGTTGGEYTADDFVNAVNAIDNATTIEEKQVAIKYAQDVFNALPQEEKLKDETQNAFGRLSDKQQALAKQLQTPTSLSGGEIAGICVGCVVGVALIGVILYFVIFRRKASRS